MNTDDIKITNGTKLIGRDDRTKRDFISGAYTISETGEQVYSLGMSSDFRFYSRQEIMKDWMPLTNTV